MDNFGDLYTMAFKNLSSLFLPIVLGMFMMVKVVPAPGTLAAVMVPL